LRVNTNASTIFAGGAPAVGQYAVSTGSGSLTTSVTAAFVALSPAAPTSVTLTGTASSSTAYGFLANAGSSYLSVPVVMNKVTIVAGSSLVAGATIKVTGTGSLGNAVLASSIVVSTPSPPPGTIATPTPGPISQKHVLTYDVLGTPYGTTSISWSSAAPYLTWAQTGYANATAIAATGIKTRFYSDPNKTSPNMGDPMYSSDETEFAHNCNGNRVSDLFNNQTQYVMDIGGASLQSSYANYINNMSHMGHFDAVFQDDAGPPMQDPYVTYSGTPCGYSDAAWLVAGQTLNQASSLPIIVNGLEIFNGQSPSETLGLLQSTNTIGGSLEHCYSDNAQPKMGGWVWQVTENTELQVASENKLFFCGLRNMNAASAQIDPRIYALASFLLTYNPSTSVLGEQYATGTGFHVLPESQLVVLDPVGATPTSASSMIQTGGAYGRQYGQCYIAGSFVGSCAIAVNSSSSAVPNPFPQYNHTLVVSGGGVLDGGTVAANGPAAPASLGGLEAEIVFP
jgi:hypothetical protein